MKVVACPHCGNHRVITTKVPKDVVVVLPCPSCHELVVLFRNKVIALNRNVLENGSFEERKAHIAEVIAEFIDPEMFKGEHALGSGESPLEQLFGGVDAESMADALDESDEEPISADEFDHFVKFELKRIDDPSYFRKHFG